MTCGSAYRIGTAMAACVALYPLHAKSDGPWSCDTVQVGTSIRAARMHQAHWSLDSMAHHAGSALAQVDECLAAMAASKDPARKHALLEARGTALGLLAASGTDGEHLRFAEEALQLFLALPDARKAADMRQRIAGWHHRNADYMKALEHYRKALADHKALGAEQEASDILNSMGVSYRLMGDLGQAMDHHLNALPVIERSGDQVRIGWNRILIGAVFRAKGEPRAAIVQFQLARAAYARASNLSGLAGASNDLGSAYQAVGDLDSAMHWHSISADLRLRTGEFNGQGDSHHYMGQILYERDDLAAAMEHLEQARAAYGRVPNPIGQSSVLKSMSLIDLDRGRYTSALEHLDRALVLLEGGSHTAERSALYLRMGKVHERSGNAPSAIRAFDQAAKIASADGHHAGIMRAKAALFEFQRERGDARSAFNAHREYLAAKDRVRRQKNSALVTQLAMRYGMEEQELNEQYLDALQRSQRETELTDRRERNKVFMAGGALSAALAFALLAGIRTHARARSRSEDQRDRLKRAKERAVQGEQFKERFLANMSHEVRTPMNAIVGMTAILQRNQHLPAQAAHLDAISRNANGLLRILNDILDMSKLEAGRLELELGPMHLRDLIDGVMDQLAPQAEARGITLRTEIDEAVPGLVQGDAMRLRQVLWNLVDNAIKFTGEGGVKITARTAEGLWLLIEVADSGAGIPPERLGRIFEEFTRVYSEGHRQHGGTGLGLAIGKRLAELHGGSLTAASEHGKGSTFTVSLPLVPVGSMPDHARKHAAEMELRDLRILLAEDNEFNAIVAQDELRDAIPGVLVDRVVNGIEAIGLARVNTYDVVLMDVQMPEMNGYDAARAIRQLEGAKARVPILAMTANVMASEKEVCRAAGMDGHIPKPFTREELLRALRAALQPTMNKA